jgi:dihydrofolate reductase
MTKVICDITMSVDGYVAGPNQTLEQPLGRGGEQLHEWIVATEAFRETHGMDGGEDNADSRRLEEHIRSIGATIMGRRMFSGGSGPWEEDPNAASWFGDQPPFRHAVFVLTHHERDPEVKEGGTTYTFVTDGIESALELARAAADGRNVQVAGGANVVQQYLAGGLLDELQVHVAPVLLGGGARLFDQLGSDPPKLERLSVVDSPAAAHLRYRVVK